MRPISLAVDVTNYVMLELGQPLHAYDLATLPGAIVVRRARGRARRSTTLDDVDAHARRRGPADHRRRPTRPLGLAGVMGGADAPRSPRRTTDVLIEAAHFDPVSIARTARRHKLPSEASKRFERGVDPTLAAAAAAAGRRAAGRARRRARPTPASPTSATARPRAAIRSARRPADPAGRAWTTAARPTVRQTCSAVGCDGRRTVGRRR